MMLFFLALPILAALVLYGLYRLRRRYAASRGVRWFMAALWLTLAAFCALMFYERYWIWRDCFDEEGRCYVPDVGTIGEQAGPIWMTFTALFAVLFLANLYRLWRPKTAPAAS